MKIVYGNTWITGYTTRRFYEALPSSFNLLKGECLNAADDEMKRVYGKAKNLVDNPQSAPKKVVDSWFSKDLLLRINDTKIKKLCG